MTEMEKDERVRTPPPQCIDKRLWDYSIHLIGPGPRASKQIAACHERGVPVHMKTEGETGFEGVRLPHLPCVDRWLQRAESMANCGAAGAPSVLSQRWDRFEAGDEVAVALVGAGLTWGGALIEFGPSEE